MIAAQAAPAKIRFEDVGKTFEIRTGPVTAIEQISLDIPAGSFFVIVGPSGCGKTTLLRMAAGLETPTRGTITIARERSDRPANSMIFQGESIFPWMTVFDNAAYGLRMRNAPASEINDVVGHYLRRHEAARVDRARVRQRSRSAADGRTVLGPRRAEQNAVARRALAHLGRDEEDGAVHHA
jgi:NitT/TauT family transport system ATP-binding protein